MKIVPLNQNINQKFLFLFQAALGEGMPKTTLTNSFCEALHRATDGHEDQVCLPEDLDDYKKNCDPSQKVVSGYVNVVLKRQTAMFSSESVFSGLSDTSELPVIKLDQSFLVA